MRSRYIRVNRPVLIVAFSYFILGGICSSTSVAQTLSGGSWGAWNPTHQPGILFRAICKYDSPGPNNAGTISLWNYEFKNTGSSSDIVWKIEQFTEQTGRNALGSPMTQTVAGGTNSPVFDTTLLGSCKNIPSLLVRLLPKQTSQSPGNQTKPGSSAAQGSGTTNGGVSSRSTASGSTGSRSSSSSRPSTSQNGSSSAQSASVGGSSWHCQRNYQDGNAVGMVIAFNTDGNYTMTRDDNFDLPYQDQWSATGDSVKWADTNVVYSGMLSGNSMNGTMIPLPGSASYNRGTFTCTRR